MSAKSPTPNEEADHLRKLQEKGVEYSTFSEGRTPGTDFKGTLQAFSLVFEWKWEDAESKMLIEKRTGEVFSGWIEIQDESLDPLTYPGQCQKIKFEEGRVKFIESVDTNETTD